MEEKKFYQIHRSDAIQVLLTKEKLPGFHTNIKLGELLEDYFSEKNRSYVVIEDNLPLNGNYSLTALSF